MLRCVLACVVVALLPTASTFNVSPTRTSKRSSSLPSPRAPTPDSYAELSSKPSPLEDAWSTFVLVRPGMTYHELKATTTGSLAGRTPGTIRTVILTSALVLLAAVPYIVQNPLVIGWILELAVLGRAGVTPADMLERTGRLW